MDVTVVVVVDDIVFVFLDDFHGREHVESIVDSALYIFEINFLTDLPKHITVKIHIPDKITCISLGFHLRSEFQSPLACHELSAKQTSTKIQVFCLFLAHCLPRRNQHYFYAVRFSVS